MLSDFAFMATGGPRGEKSGTVTKKRAAERQKYRDFDKVQYTESERKMALTVMKSFAKEEQVSFAEVCNNFISNVGVKFSGYLQVAAHLISERAFRGDHGYLRQKLKAWWNAETGKDKARKGQRSSESIQQLPVAVQPQAVDPELEYIGKAKEHVAKMTAQENSWLDYIESHFQKMMEPPHPDLERLLV